MTATTYQPVHLISLGAGVQSSTMALMAACGEIKPMPAAAIFADTQAEPPSVYEWLDWLERQLPFPVHRVRQANDRGQLSPLSSQQTTRPAENQVHGPTFMLGDAGWNKLDSREWMNVIQPRWQNCTRQCVSWPRRPSDEQDTIPTVGESWRRVPNHSNRVRGR